MVKRVLLFAAIQLLTVGMAFVVASPMLAVDRKPPAVSVAASRVMLALLQPSLSLFRSLPIGELPLILLNSLLWGISLAIMMRTVQRNERRLRRAFSPRGAADPTVGGPVR